MSIGSEITQLLMNQGTIAANAAQQQGQIAGQTISNVGQQIGGAITAATSPQAQEYRRLQAGRKVLATALKTVPPKADGTPDYEGIATFAGQQGFSDVGESFLSSVSKNKENLAKLDQMGRDAQKAAQEYQAHQLATIGDAAFHSKTPDEFTSSVGLLALHGQLGKTPQENEQQAQAILARADQGGPDGWQGMRNSYLKFSPAWQDAEKKKGEPFTLPPTPEGAAPAERIVGGNVIATGGVSQPKPGPAPTEASLDAAAQALLAKQAIGQKLTAEEAANLKAYQDRKRTVSDPALLASMDRQEKTIAAQVAAQTRTQNFAEAQAGRKELGEKIEQPYQTAIGSANTLRDVVAAAKNGNKVAASLQSLETTMAAIRAQGLNRINTAEIGVAANAGSLWDNIVGKVGKLIAGQPIPADLQKDMTEFADILEKAAYKKYESGWDSTTKRYNLSDEKKLAPPNAPAQGTAGTINGKPAVWDYRGGKWGWYGR